MWRNSTLKKNLSAFYTAYFTLSERQCFIGWKTQTCNNWSGWVVFGDIPAQIILCSSKYMRNTFVLYDPWLSNKSNRYSLFYFWTKNFSKCLSYKTNIRSLVYRFSVLVIIIPSSKLLLNQDVNTWISVKMSIEKIFLPTPLIQSIEISDLYLSENLKYIFHNLSADIIQSLRQIRIWNLVLSQFYWSPDFIPYSSTTAL